MSAILSAQISAEAENAKTRLHEYLNYSLPIDIRHMVTMVDVDISQALGTGLVQPGPDGQVISGLANKWQIDAGNRFIDFHLDPRAKWSNGEKITTADIIASFRDAKAHFQKEIPGVFESYSHMETQAENILRVHLVPGVTPGAFLAKLFEPTLGIVKIVNWAPSLKITSGPYTVKSVDEKELVLEVNPHWIFHSPSMISEIHLRRTDKFVTASTLLEDQWPDMVNLTTGITKQELSKLPHGYSILRLHEQRLLNLRYIGHGNLEGARTLFGYLRGHAEFQKIADLFEGGHLAKQFFPASLPLSGKTPGRPEISLAKVKADWKRGDIKIAYSRARLQPEIKDALESMLKETLPFQVEFHGLDTKEMSQAHLSRKYDLLFGSVGIGDSNLDGALSYYIEQQPPHFPSDKTAKGNFLARLKAVRLLPGDHTQAFRDIVFDAVDQNYFLPIAHFPTIFVARPTIDFKQVKESGQDVPFSSIRRSK